MKPKFYKYFTLINVFFFVFVLVFNSPSPHHGTFRPFCVIIWLNKKSTPFKGFDGVEEKEGITMIMIFHPPFFQFPVIFHQVFPLQKSLSVFPEKGLECVLVDWTSFHFNQFHSHTLSSLKSLPEDNNVHKNGTEDDLGHLRETFSGAFPAASREGGRKNLLIEIQTVAISMTRKLSSNSSH